MRNRNWFWGVFFLLAAVFVILSQVGAFGEIGFVSILATVVLIALIIQSLVKQFYFGIFIPLAFLYMIFSTPLSLIFISPWLLILAAVLTSIGFSVLFHKHHKKVEYTHEGTKYYNQTNQDIDDNNPYAKVSLSSSSIYLHSECLEGGHFGSSLGVLEVYFDQVKLSPNGTKLFLECKLGSIKLYIPKNWNVSDNLHISLGDVKNHSRHNNTSENEPKLILEGNVSLGDVQILYI